MLLAASEGYVAAVITTVGVVLVAAIGGAVKIILKQLDANVSILKQVDANVGVANGHGPANEAIGKIIKRLDKDEESRLAGQERQTQMQLRQNDILEAIGDIRAAQATFVTRDEFQHAVATLDRLSALIGAPEDGWDTRPVLPYVHSEIHALRNELTRALLKLDAIARHPQPPTEEDPDA